MATIGYDGTAPVIGVSGSRPMAFSLRQIQFFIAVAENGSISGAAQELAVSQSTITEALKELEADLGVTLLQRHARGVAVTHKGQLFLRHAERIWLDVTDARRALTADIPTVNGRLVLGVTSLVAGYVLADILARFRRAFPGVDVSVVEDGHDHLEHLLLNGEIDLALVIISGLHNTDSLRAEILDAYPLRVWLPLGHPLAARASISLPAIAALPQIVLDLDEIEESADQVWRASGLRPNVVFRTRSVEAVRSLVATGMGISVLPELVFRPWSLEGHRLEARDIEGDAPRAKAALVWRRGSKLDAAARRFVEVTLAQKAPRRG